MNRVAFFTLGCKVNQYDTAAMARLFRRQGWQVVDFGEEADAYVVNTCAVTRRSEAKSRQAVRQARRRHPGAVVAVCGCYPQGRAEEVLLATGADVVLGTRGRARIVSLVERALAGKKPLVAAEDFTTGYEELPAEGGERTRAFLKVQEGCDMRCSYCLVPLVRGPARSRDPEAALAEARRLLEAGYREIVLTGIQLGAYGRDLGEEEGLARLVERVASLEGLWRLRLSSVEPTDLSSGLLRVMRERSTVCPHLHLPLQSGSDRILQAMGRPYTTAGYLEVVERARETIPDLALSTDLLVGFPGEEEEDFRCTLQAVREAGFMRLHVFPFSPRPGTPAATWPQQVPEEVKEERARHLRELGADLAAAFARRFWGETVEVLVEEARECLAGFTPHYLRVRFPGDPRWQGALVRVRVRGQDEEALWGEPLVEVLAADGKE